ncbi:MAG: Gfo/Idh/MocA family oxidoreductase [Dehalococcoidales bacterium]|nr:Gfo/Idh/MocA family oxidoreductase [Dehalococcoidales bacterium]
MKVAIIGAGEVVRNFHMPAWKHIKEAQIVAICDINEEHAALMAKRYNIPHYYTSINELLTHEEVFLVDICTPPSTHLSLSIQAMEAGCHVLLEKPMAVSIQESEEIVKRAQFMRKSKNIKLGVIHNLLFYPWCLRMRSLVEQHVGDIISMEVTDVATPNDIIVANPDHWIHKLMGGRFGEGFIHEVYLLQHFLGQLQVDSVWTTKIGAQSWIPYDGLHTTFSAGKRFGSISVAYNSSRPDFKVVIYGQRCNVKYENFGLTVLPPLGKGAYNFGVDALRQNSQQMISTAIGGYNAWRGVWKSHEIYFRSFIESIINNSELPLSLEEAYKATETYLLVLQRAESLKKSES